ncbi:MAG: DUF418 domain-containing protein [Rubrivivax sp.]|jgi:uncharacterized protein|nr:DUF418 domain-containing protein [Rubrivivax sp.]
MRPSAAREPLPDALRALAMLAVLVVNAAGYLVAPWGPLLGERTPPDSGVATAVQGLTAAMLQGKGYPMLAFLFGMGLVLASRGREPMLASARATTRQKRLLVLGVLHGVFVYFGDILTMYALIGWHLLSRVREPWRSFRRRLWRALWWALGVTALTVLLMLFIAMQPDLAGEPTMPADEPAVVQALRWVDFWIVNASAYGVIQLGSLLLAWPVLRLCMLCGIAAARLRLLTHRRWRAALERWIVRTALPLLLLNLGYGWAYISASTGSERAFWVESLGNLIGPPFAAVYVMVLALAARGGTAAWCRSLAPLGQRTLTLYVGHGLLCVLLFGGVGLGLELSTLDMAIFSVVLWSLALALAHASRARRWPLEAWLARR